MNYPVRPPRGRERRRGRGSAGKEGWSGGEGRKGGRDGERKRNREVDMVKEGGAVPLTNRTLPPSLKIEAGGEGEVTPPPPHTHTITRLPRPPGA